MRRLLVLFAAAALAVAGFAACGDDDGDDTADDTTTTEADADDGELDEEAATAEIEAALTTFFESDDDDTILALIAGGDDPEFAELFRTLNASLRDLVPEGGVTPVNVEATFTSATEADVTFGVALQENPEEVLIEQAGIAVLEDGQWKVSAVTVCDLAALGEPTLGAECAEVAATL